MPIFYMKKTIILFIVFFLSNSWAQIFVDPNGDDNNSGTINFPLKSIISAVNRIQLGDTIYVRGGIYILSDNDKIVISV